MRHEKLHAILARSTFGSQTSEKRPVLGHFCKSRCRKSASVVARSKFSSQNVQSTSMSDQVGSGYVEKVYAAVARSTLPSQRNDGSQHFWDVQMLSCLAGAGDSVPTLQSITLHSTPLQQQLQLQLQQHYITLQHT